MDYWIHPNSGTRIKEELLKLNVTVPKHDLGLFMYQCTGSLHGILVTHVDDFFMERITCFYWESYQTIKQNLEN